MSSKVIAEEIITRPAKNITCILAPNPSPMTFKGTNTYVVGDVELAIIDPGPINDEHLVRIFNVIENRPVKYILDRAEVPARKSAPNRLLFLIAGGFIGLFGSTLITVFRY